MANEPAGDIELTMPPPQSTAKGLKSQNGNNEPTSLTRMRVRLDRRHWSVQISRYTAPSSGNARGSAIVTGAGEWIKKVLPVSGKPPKVDQDDWRALEQCEQAGLSLLWYFMRVCEAVEEVPEGELETGSSLNKDDSCKSDGLHGNAITLDDSAYTIKHCQWIPQQRDEPRNTVGGHKELRPTSALTSCSPLTATIHHSTASQTHRIAPDASSQEPRTCSSSISRSILTAATGTATTLSSVFVAPRPARFATISSASSVRDSPLEGSHAGSGCCASSGDSSVTRFVENVGWCHRQETQNGVRYNVLHSDGTSTVIDPRDERGYVLSLVLAFV